MYASDQSMASGGEPAAASNSGTVEHGGTVTLAGFSAVENNAPQPPLNTPTMREENALYQKLAAQVATHELTIADLHMRVTDLEKGAKAAPETSAKAEPPYRDAMGRT